MDTIYLIIYIAVVSKGSSQHQGLIVQSTAQKHSKKTILPQIHFCLLIRLKAADGWTTQCDRRGEDSSGRIRQSQHYVYSPSVISSALVPKSAAGQRTTILSSDQTSCLNSKGEFYIPTHKHCGMGLACWLMWTVSALRVQAILQSRKGSTRKCYKQKWNWFVIWATSKGLIPSRAEAPAVLEYLPYH